MSLSFVYGPAGSGKSTYLQDMLINKSSEEKNRNFILIVPDQFTMQTQADIVKRHERHGILNVDVLSFGRLTHRVFEETGRPVEKVLDDTGKSLVIRHVSDRISDRMPYIGKNLSKVGYVHEVKSSISEFMQYGVDVNTLKAFGEKNGSSLLKTKVGDLSVIYEEFKNYNKGKFITGEETLDILCRKIPYCSSLKNAFVVFDGFTGFTPVQERVIMALLDNGCEVVISLTISDNRKPEDNYLEEDLFYLSGNTVNRLLRQMHPSIKREKDIEVGMSLPRRFKANSGLAHIERHLFRYPIGAYEGHADDVEMFSADSIKTEVDETCYRILKLIREEGYAYRDIAIVSGNLENYADFFERRFNEIGIPCFIDRTRGIILNPFTEYLKSAIRILIKDYSYDSVFHFLKSGFTDFGQDETDRLALYASAVNLRGKKAYSKEFKRTPKGLSSKEKDKELLKLIDCNVTREKLVCCLAPLEKPAETAGEYVRNLYEFLKANDSYNKLRVFEDKFSEENNLSKAREYAQIYRLIIELLDTIDSLVGDEKMSLEEFYKIFEAGIAEMTVGTIPQGVDRLIVGDIERTRLKEVRALFFVGVNDGNIPKNAEKPGILSNTDRMVFKSCNIDLSPTPREEMFSQRLYLYMNMCKPSERLFLSYAEKDRDGKALKASYLVESLKRLFPENKIEQIVDNPRSSRISSLYDSYKQFAVTTRKIAAGTADAEEEKLAKALLEIYKENKDDQCSQILDSAFFEYEAKSLSREIVDAIYENVISGGISRMQTFASCAYSHFLKYAMHLEEAIDSEINYADLGNIYHGVLELFSMKLAQNGLTWTNFCQETGNRLIEESVKEYVEDYEQGMLSDDASRQYLIVKITRLMQRTVDTLKYQFNKGSFLPRSFETPFSRTINLDRGKTLNLVGRIDRIDMYEKEGDVYVRVVDYKSSSKEIKINEVYYGLKEQLGVYIEEAMRHEAELHPNSTVHPSAVLYYTMDNPIVDMSASASDEEVNEKIREKLKMNGLVLHSDLNLLNTDEDFPNKSEVVAVSINKDGSPNKNSKDKLLTEEEFSNFIDYTSRTITRIGNKIFEGDIRINPITGSNNSCEYCSYKTICRFDEKIPGYKYREEDVDDESMRNSVMGGDHSGDYLFG